MTLMARAFWDACSRVMIATAECPVIELTRPRLYDCRSIFETALSFHSTGRSHQQNVSVLLKAMLGCPSLREASHRNFTSNGFGDLTSTSTYQIFETRQVVIPKKKKIFFSASCTIFISTLSRKSSWKCFQQCVLNLFYKAERFLMASFSKKRVSRLT